jgi:hypothetical protein
LAAVFAKLFLLQGIAYLCDINENGNNRNPISAQQRRQSRERLDQAFVLLQCLRSMTPDESVQQLLEVMGSASTMYSERQFTASDAIAALRKSRGNMDVAANALAEEETKRRQRQSDREVQHQHGLCQNETDPVDLGHLEILKPLLKGQDSNNSAIDMANAEVAVGLLRLADNDLTRALGVYAEQDHDAHKVHALVDALDQRLVQHGLLGRAVLLEKKKKKRKLYDSAAQQTVDEMALVTLVSMGVDHSKAQTALEKNGNDVEKAMLWLSTSAAEQEVPTRQTNDDQQDASGRTPSLGEDGGGAEEDEGDSPMDDSESAPRDALRIIEWEAQELLRRELGDVLEVRDLEKEYLGNHLNEEWRLVQKYRQSK